MERIIELLRPLGKRLWEVKIVGNMLGAGDPESEMILGRGDRLWDVTASEPGGCFRRESDYIFFVQW